MKFDWWEVLLIVGFVLLGASQVENWWRARFDTATLYRDRYGPEKHSQFEEEWLVRHFFQDSRDGFFVDVGAAHYREHSNTYYLETVLGWSGIAVDAQQQFADEFATHRPRTRFVTFFVSDKIGGDSTIYVPKNAPLVASGSAEYAVAAGGAVDAITVQTTTLTKLLDEFGIERVDFLSMDIERSEPRALAGFDIERFQPALVCVEAHLPIRQELLNYFADHRYVLVGDYLAVDTYNFYFTPRSRAATLTPALGRHVHDH